MDLPRNIYRQHVNGKRLSLWTGAVRKLEVAPVIVRLSHSRWRTKPFGPEYLSVWGCSEAVTSGGILIHHLGVSDEDGWI